MPRAFARIAFTPSVESAQRRYGAREANRHFETAHEGRCTLSERETAFIEARDSFYQATVSESGWPYVQHRGGPPGFLRVLDEHTIGFADYRGNLQYLSVGNLAANDRIALILMDYANRRRLKIWGRARVVDEPDDPALVARLEVPAYRARVERAVVIGVEAFDWNCPQHITRRFSEREVERMLAPLREGNRGLAARASAEPLGAGPLELVVSGVRQLTPRVRAFELRHPGGEDLPAVAAGAHLEVPVRLADGREAVRAYSISSNPARRDAYEIAVLEEPEGRGGSRFAHTRFTLGTRLRCTLPPHGFRLHDDARPALLIAGGIGITPLKPMAQTLLARGAHFRLHYAGRSAREMAYRDRLQRELGEHLSLHVADAGGRMDLDAVLAGAPADAVFYVCGPARLIDAAVASARALRIAPQRLRFERFSRQATPGDRPLTVTLRRSRRSVAVAAQQSILDAVEAAGIAAPAGCRAGNCGTCAVKVLEGTPEHRDAVLTPAQRDGGGLMCPCVSRARSERLVLDL